MCSRLLPSLVAAVAVTFPAACSLVSSSDQEVFTLETIDGQPLPATMTSATATDGTTYELQAIRGLIAVKEGGKLQKELDARNLWNGVATDTIRGKWSGTYVRTDSTVVIHFTDPQAGTFTISYTLLDGGRRLRGVEGTFPPKTYEYVRP